MTLSGGADKLHTIGIEHGETEIRLRLDFNRSARCLLFLFGKVRREVVTFRTFVQFEGKHATARYFVRSMAEGV